MEQLDPTSSSSSIAFRLFPHSLTAMATAQKVLVTGRATNGLAAYFKKLETMQSKHSFSVVLALDLFSGLEDNSLELAQLMAGQISVPKVQIYVSVGQGSLPSKVQLKVDNGEEVCENVTVLGEEQAYHCRPEEVR